MNFFLICLAIAVVVALAVYLFPKLRYRARDAKKAINDALANPVKDHGHRIDDARAKVQETRNEMTEAIVANKGLQQKAKAADRDLEKYARLSKNAAKAQDVEAVGKFIKEKQRAEARKKTFLAQIDANDHIISTVKRQLSERGDQIENAEANKEILEAQLSGTRLRQDMARTGAGLADDDLGDLGQLQTHVSTELARAEAFEEVYGKSEADLEAKYSAEGDTIDEETAKLLAAHKPVATV